MEFKIEKNVPIKRPVPNMRYPFNKMAIGDSFKYPVKFKNRIGSSASTYSKKNNTRFTTRTNGTVGRIWRIR